MSTVEVILVKGGCSLVMGMWQKMSLPARRKELCTAEACMRLLGAVPVLSGRASREGGGGDGVGLTIASQGGAARGGLAVL
jgi:hypothetical protein